ncbi:MAG: tetratricopeptide repeat protein [Alphaproteobacteria bacterium]|nr:tetratricopeptide repeat protein [Alphaproteobacteria bacterium]
MRAATLGYLAAAVAALSIPAAGSPARNPAAAGAEWAQCQGGQGISRDARLSACAAVVKSVRAPKGRRTAAHVYRCSLLFDKGDMDAAIEECTRAIKLDPKSVDAYHTRAVAYLSQKKNDLAIADCNVLLVLRPERAGTLILRGMAYSQKGDYDRAIVDFTLSLQLRPGFGMAESGLRDARQAKARLAGGQKLGDPRAWCDGLALPQEGFVDDLQISGCTKLIQSGGEKPDDLVRDYFNRAGAYDDEGNAEKAIADFDEVIKLKPDHAKAYWSRGSLYWVKKDYDRAIADLTNAVKYDPRQASSFSYRGYAYSAKGQYDLAIADFSQAIALQPDDGDAFVNRCRAYNGKGDYDRAIADCDRAIELSRTSEATEGHDGRGDALFLKRDFKAAIEDYDASLKLWPEYPEALYGRGAAKTRNGDVAGGRADLDAARKLEPEVEAAEAKLGIAP